MSRKKKTKKRSPEKIQKTGGHNLFANIAGYRYSHLIFVLVLVIIGAWLRLDYVFTAEHMPVTSDAMDYVKIARSIVERGTMSYGYSKEPSAYVMPGFPLFLAGILKMTRIFGWSEQAFFQTVRFFFALMSLSWIVFIYLTVHKLSENTWLGLLAAAIVCFYPPFIWCSERILTEVPYTFTLIIAVWLMARAWKNPGLLNYGLFGVAVGITLLVRPIMLWFLPLFIIADFIKSRKESLKPVFLRSALLAGSAIICLTPWMIRNAVQFKEFIPLSTSGGNPLMIGTYYNYNRTDPFPRGDTETETDRLQKEFARKRFFQELKKAPVKYSLWYAGKIRSLWTISYGIYDGWNLPPFKRSLVQFTHRIMVLLFIIGMIAIIIRRDKPWYVIALFLFYHTLILVPFIGIPRYSFPMMPVASAAAAYGIWFTVKAAIVMIPKIWETRIHRIFAAAGGAGILLAIVFNSPVERGFWLASGFSPGISGLMSFIYGFFILILLLLPMLKLGFSGKTKGDGPWFSVLTSFLLIFFLATVTRAGGLNPIKVFSEYKETYTVLLQNGDTVTKKMEIPDWVNEYDEVRLRMFAGFNGTPGKNDRVGIFLNETPFVLVSSENPMKPGWFEIKISEDIIRKFDSLKVEVRVLQVSTKTLSKPFLIGVTRNLNRGKNLYNGQSDDLSPYTTEKVTGSFQILMKMVKDDEQELIWWGKRR